MSEPSKVPASEWDTGYVPSEIELTKVSDYTTFEAEYHTFEDEKRTVFHFYPTDEVKANEWAGHYWSQVFPKKLEQVAMEHFKAESPTLVASYFEEMASWWLEYRESIQALDSDAFIASFLEKLDGTLNPSAGPEL